MKKNLLLTCLALSVLFPLPTITAQFEKHASHITEMVSTGNQMNNPSFDHPELHGSGPDDISGPDFLSEFPERNLKSLSTMEDSIGDAPAWNWAVSFGGSGGSYGSTLTVDTITSSFIVSGDFYDTMRIDHIQLASISARDAFIAKYDQNGQVQWVVQGSGSPGYEYEAISSLIDTAGNIYVGGLARGFEFTLGGQTHTVESVGDFWLAKLDPAGNVLWLTGFPRSVSGSGYNSFFMDLDDSNNIYIASDGYLLKFDTEGDLVWNRNESVTFSGIKAMGNNLFAVGQINSPVQLDAIYVETYIQSLVLLKMNTNGECEDALLLEPDPNTFDYKYSRAEMAVMNDSSFAIAGYYYTDMIIGDDTLRADPGAYKMFIAGLSTDLEVNWVFQPDLSNNWAMEIVSRDGLVYVLGQINTPNTILDGFPLDYGRVLISLDNEGNLVQTYQDPENVYTPNDFDLDKSGRVYYLDILNYNFYAMQSESMGNNNWVINSESTAGFITNNFGNVDKNGNTYITGTTSGQYYLFDKKISGMSGYVTKMDQDGLHLWTRTFHAPNLLSSGLTTDHQGNAYTWGWFEGSLKFDDGVTIDYLTEEGGGEFYFLKLNSNGNVEFLKQFDKKNMAGIIWAGTNGIDIDSDGNIVLLLNFSDTLFIEDQMLVSNLQSRDIAVVRLDPSGNLLMAKSFGGEYPDEGYDVSTDQLNNIYITGTYNFKTGFDLDTLYMPDGASQAGFLVKLIPNGKVAWVREFVPKTSEYAEGINLVTNDQGESYINGWARLDTLVLGETEIPSQFGYNLHHFLVKYNTDGYLEWANLISKKAWSSWITDKIDLDEKGNVYINGEFIDSIYFDPLTTWYSDATTQYIAKYRPDGSLDWAKDLDIEGGLQTVNVFKEDNVVVTGYFDGILKVGSNTLSSSNTNGFVAFLGSELNPCDLQVEFVLDQEISCPGSGSGVLIADAYNGTGPYHYEWEGLRNVVSNVATGLDGNKYYKLTVTDDLGCMVVDSFYLPEPDPIMIEFTLTDNDPEEQPGSAEAMVSGGTPPYRYIWSSGDTTTIADSLDAGIYSLVVIDGNGCEESKLATVNDMGAPVITLNTLTQVSCAGGGDGAIGIDVTGGLEPYTFEWSNGASTEDVSGLTTGPYELKVTSANDLVAVRQFVIAEPAKLDVDLTLKRADCGEANGRAAVTVIGGVPPYSYEWSSGEFTSYAENLAVGVYSVTVTDQSGCQVTSKAPISEVGAPVVDLVDYVEPTCAESNGSLEIEVSGGSGDYSILWEDDTTDPVLSSIPEGEYSVQVTDNKLLCTAVGLYEILEGAPQSNPICLVTVDSVSGANEIVWERVQETGVAYYNVYRESSIKGTYFLAGQVPAAEETRFIDSLADPMVRSYRYVISAVDECGNESDLSESHRTMHLTMNIGLNDVINLIWNHYEGFEITTYHVWRWSEAGGWELLESISADLTSYTDFNPPDGDITYYIEVEHPEGCEPTSLKAGTLNSSKSNRQSKLKTKSTVDLNEISSWTGLRIYPNPTSGILYLELPGDFTSKLKFELVDARGSILFNGSFSDCNKGLFEPIDLSFAPNGVYYLKLISDKQYTVRKIIIE